MTFQLPFVFFIKEAGEIGWQGPFLRPGREGNKEMLQMWKLQMPLWCRTSKKAILLVKCNTLYTTPHNIFWCFFSFLLEWTQQEQRKTKLSFCQKETLCGCLFIWLEKVVMFVFEVLLSNVMIPCCGLGYLQFGLFCVKLFRKNIFMVCASLRYLYRRKRPVTFKKAGAHWPSSNSNQLTSIYLLINSKQLYQVKSN